MLAWDQLITDWTMQRHEPLGLWLEAKRLAPFWSTIRLDASPAKILGAAPYGVEAFVEQDIIEVTVAHRERAPIVATSDTRVYLLEFNDWVPLWLCKPGDHVVVPEPNKGGPSVSARPIVRIKKIPKPEGLEQARQVRFGLLRTDPRGEFCTPAGFVKCHLDRCALVVRP